MFNPQKALQDYFPGNPCCGCGPLNPRGLRLKTHWSPEKNETLTFYTPLPHQASAFLNAMHGGVVASLLDCPLIFTAMADHYRVSGIPFGSLEPLVWYVTGTIRVVFLKPVPMDSILSVRAFVVKVEGKKREVAGELRANQTLCAMSEMVAIRKIIAPPDVRRLSEPLLPAYSRLFAGEQLTADELSVVGRHYVHMHTHNGATESYEDANAVPPIHRGAL